MSGGLAELVNEAVKAATQDVRLLRAVEAVHEQLSSLRPPQNREEAQAMLDGNRRVVDALYDAAGAWLTAHDRQMAWLKGGAE